MTKETPKSLGQIDWEALCASLREDGYDVAIHDYRDLDPVQIRAKEAGAQAVASCVRDEALEKAAKILDRGADDEIRKALGFNASSHAANLAKMIRALKSGGSAA